MNMTGREIHRAHDDLGVVQVFDDGDMRYLTFGTDHQQSCALKSDPAYLSYDYTRAMLLPLLFEDNPRKGLILGLGAGSLATCLNRHCRQLKLTAVELRQTVIDAAYKYFQLPSGKKLNVVAANAADYLREHEPANFNIIFSDIYGPDGIDDLQLQERFIDQCLHSLTANGWLVLNCWKNHRNDSDILPLLRDRFAYVGECNTQAGNWVILACRQAPRAGQNQLRERAKAWSQKLGFPLPLARLQDKTRP